MDDVWPDNPHSSDRVRDVVIESKPFYKGA